MMNSSSKSATSTMVFLRASLSIFLLVFALVSVERYRSNNSSSQLHLESAPSPSVILEETVFDSSLSLPKTSHDVGRQSVLNIRDNTKTTALPVWTTGKQPSIANCTTIWYDQVLDHFSWHTASKNVSKFKQRFIIYDKFWRKEKDGSPQGPIFFYTGNEGEVSLYVNNTGLMWENAENFGALLIFGEHRYYGQSQPFRRKPYNSEDLVYLTHEQALADYAVFLYEFKRSNKAEHAPVVAFGGSYGGMLSAWFRMKYPDTVIGAISASAPVLAFPGFDPAFDSKAYARVVTHDASPEAGSSRHCAANVRSLWKVLFKLGKTKDGRKTLQEAFKICDEFEGEETVQFVAFWLKGAFETMAMGNFPFPSSYLTGGAGELPPWPVRVACESLAVENMSPMELLHGMREAVSVLYNITKDQTCFNLSQSDDTSAIEADVYEYQSCTELMPISSFFESDGIDDMFWKLDVNITSITEGCQNQFNVTPQADWIRVSYGESNYATATNIVFSNGLMDPWSAGGVFKSPSPSVLAVTIPEGGHHLDLFFSHPEDPESVRVARNLELGEIRKWIAEFKGKQHAERTT